jgi:hypothetical protein
VHARTSRLLRRTGLLGFAFFMLKGLAWIAVVVAGVALGRAAPISFAPSTAAPERAWAPACGNPLLPRSQRPPNAAPPRSSRYPPPMTAPYESRLPYERTRIRAAAIYCSDGRIGEHFDDFLQNGLGLPRYDRVALPGGPACLAGHPQAHLEEQGVVDELKFLAEVHGLKRIVLIAHESCAFYTSRLELKDRPLELVQRADLVRAAA